MENQGKDPSTIIASEKSTHWVECFVLDNLVKHPDADTLSVIRITGTDYTYVGKTEEWADKLGRVVAWVPPDSIVDVTRPEFAFLGAKGSRVRARKIRGIVSYGLLVLAPDTVKPGENAAEALGVQHYDPEAGSTPNLQGSKKKGLQLTGGEVAEPPKGVYPRYDVDAFLKYGRKVFQPGEVVYVSEKLHGSSSRYVFRDGVMYCGSRNEWKREWTTPPKITLEYLIEQTGNPEKAQEIYNNAVLGFKPKRSLWWSILDTHPTLAEFCKTHPGWCVYGEVFGAVKNFKYGAKDKETFFRAFDILITTEAIPRWLSSDEFVATCDEFKIPRVPLVGIMPFDFDTMLTLTEGNSLIPGADHIREGIVIKPEKERWDQRLGRVSLKAINPKYLEVN